MITNRNNQNIATYLHLQPNHTGLAFVMHGLGGKAHQPHIQGMVDVFFANGFSVVSFDTTNSYGASDGQYEDATVTNYYADLEDIIAWASHQDWYQEPFVLAGHSLGGICTALFTEKHPEQVMGLFPKSTVVTGKLSQEAHQKTQVEPHGRQASI